MSGYLLRWLFLKPKIAAEAILLHIPRIYWTQIERCLASHCNSAGFYLALESIRNVKKLVTGLRHTEAFGAPAFIAVIG